MNTKYILLILLITLSNYNYSQEKLAKKQWIGSFNIGDDEYTNFQFIVKEKNKQTKLIIQNGKEKIPLESIKLEGDSISVNFLNYPTLLKFKIIRMDSISGRWINNLKKDYSIPFTAIQTKENRTVFNNKKKPTINLNGEWKTKFYTKVDTSYYYSIGIFKQKKDKITGTFLTETGDYRYLAGNVYDNEMKLTAFDGSRVFLFKATYDTLSKKLDGIFKSGNHFYNYFTSEKDANFELKKSTEITYVQETKPLSFDMMTINNETIKFRTEDYKGKVTIIQVMGTWCSNCIDETQFLKQLHKKYNPNKLQIIGLAFENGDNVLNQLTTIKNYKQKFEIDYPIYLGGKASKKNAAETFKNIFNGIFSFPTSIILDKNGNIAQIHTGFNGPGTGKFYKEYVKQTKTLINNLINK